MNLEKSFFSKLWRSKFAENLKRIGIVIIIVRQSIGQSAHVCLFVYIDSRTGPPDKISLFTLAPCTMFSPKLSPRWCRGNVVPYIFWFTILTTKIIYSFLWRRFFGEWMWWCLNCWTYGNQWNASRPYRQSWCHNGNEIEPLVVSHPSFDFPFIWRRTKRLKYAPIERSIGVNGSIIVFTNN